jgi:VanZ family protein
MLGHWLTWYVIGVAMVLFVLVESLVPSSDLPSVNVNDKVEHFVAYLGLALWFGGLTETRRYVRLWVALAVFGGVIEILQGAMKLGRQAEWNDFFSDGAGALAGLLLCLAGLRHWASWIERRKPRE